MAKRTNCPYCDSTYELTNKSTRRHLRTHVRQGRLIEYSTECQNLRYKIKLVAFESIPRLKYSIRFAGGLEALLTLPNAQIAAHYVWEYMYRRGTTFFSRSPISAVYAYLNPIFQKRDKEARCTDTKNK